MLCVKLQERSGSTHYGEVKPSLLNAHLGDDTFFLLFLINERIKVIGMLAICSLKITLPEETQLVSGNYLSFESNTFSSSCQVILMCPTWWKETHKNLCHSSLLQITYVGCLCLCLSSNQSCIASVKVAPHEPINHWAGPFSLTLRAEIQHTS